MIMILLLALAAPAAAHTGDRVFFIPYVSPDDLAYMQLDGYVDDWKEMFEEPTVTPFDFTPFYHPALTSYAEYDPSSLDWRIWLAWGDGGKLYAALQAADDLYRNVDDETVGHYSSDHFVLKVDGDHSGGQYVFLGGGGQQHKPDLRNIAQAQYYEIKSYSQADDLITIPFSASFRRWMHREPYAAAAGTALGENPTFWTVEFFATAFDDVPAEGPEGSVISDLQPGQTIGLDLVITDWDESETRMAQFFLMDPEDEMAWEGADGFVDAILVGPEQTAVETDSWARIKATLVEKSKDLLTE